MDCGYVAVLASLCQPGKWNQDDLCRNELRASRSSGWDSDRQPIADGGAGQWANRAGRLCRAAGSLFDESRALSGRFARRGGGPPRVSQCTPNQHPSVYQYRELAGDVLCRLGCPNCRATRTHFPYRGRGRRRKGRWWVCPQRGVDWGLRCGGCPEWNDLRDRCWTGLGTTGPTPNWRYQ